jgi:tryptophan-rich sensory protein
MRDANPWRLEDSLAMRPRRIQTASPVNPAAEVSSIMSKIRLILGLIGWLLASFAAAAFGGWFTPGTWYASLNKPEWNPPGWVFGPVWTLLYCAMAVAAWLVWRQGGFAAQRRPLRWYAVQLLLNAAWSPLFFGLRRPDIAFAEIVLLWLAIAMTWFTFRPVSRTAAWLLAPYLAWVSFAAVLNFTLWRMNS